MRSGGSTQAKHISRSIDGLAHGGEERAAVLHRLELGGEVRGDGVFDGDEGHGGRGRGREPQMNGMDADEEIYFVRMLSRHRSASPPRSSMW